MRRFMFAYRKATDRSTNDVDALERMLAELVMDTRNKDPVLFETDVVRILEAVVRYDEDYTIKHVNPMVKRHASNFDFVIPFLQRLAEFTKAHKIDIKVARNLCMDVSNSIVENLKFSSKEANSKSQLYEWPKKSSKFEESTKDRHEDENGLGTSQIYQLFDSMMSLQLHEQADTLIEKILTAVPDANLGTIENILVPLLKQLPPIFKQVPNSASKKGPLIQSILSSYTAKFIQPEPLKPSDWQRDPIVDCGTDGCDACPPLNGFLLCPT